MDTNDQKTSLPHHIVNACLAIRQTGFVQFNEDATMAPVDPQDAVSCILSETFNRLVALEGYPAKPVKRATLFAVSFIPIDGSDKVSVKDEMSDWLKANFAEGEFAARMQRVNTSSTVIGIVGSDETLNSVGYYNRPVVLIFDDSDADLFATRWIRYIKSSDFVFQDVYF